MPPSNTTEVPQTTPDTPLTAVGPGAIPRDHEQQPSLLDGTTEFEWVDIFNPLPMPFVAQVASSRPVNVPIKVHQTPGLQSGIRNEGDLATQYGLTGFKNPDHPSNLHVPHTIEIGPGQTRRLPGNDAQVVLKQLVGHMLQIEDKGLKLADPYERHQMEQRLIRARGNVQDLMDSAPVSVHDQMQKAIDNHNDQAVPSAPSSEPEVAFPEVTQAKGDSDGPKA